MRVETKHDRGGEDLAKDDPGDSSGNDAEMIVHDSRWKKAIGEGAGLVRAPQRVIPLVRRIAGDALRASFEQRHLYSYTKTKRESADVLKATIGWIRAAQRADGGIAAYYSLLSGYSASYPEVTGYVIPTLYDYARWSGDGDANVVAERATDWLLSLQQGSTQMDSGAFPAGLQGNEARASVFNTGQILQGLVRGFAETGEERIRRAAIAAGDWLVQVQEPSGSWCGAGAYQRRAHTYYSMVAWALAELSAHAGDESHGRAAEKNLDWVLAHFQPSGWIEGIDLLGHPNYLHFIAYVLQGALECAALRRRDDGVEAVGKTARLLLQKFERRKFLAGAYEAGFKAGRSFTCLTGNAQMACVWLRLWEVTQDLRYLNAALKMNEMLKDLAPLRGGRGVVGGVSGSYPIWGGYQPFRYISWGCKFLADALLMEETIKASFELTRREAMACAS